MAALYIFDPPRGNPSDDDTNSESDDESNRIEYLFGTVDRLDHLDYTYVVNIDKSNITAVHVLVFFSLVDDGVLTLVRQFSLLFFQHITDKLTTTWVSRWEVNPD